MGPCRQAFVSVTGKGRSLNSVENCPFCVAIQQFKITLKMAGPISVFSQICPTAGTDPSQGSHCKTNWGKKFMTFKHWNTGETKTIEFREADVPSNPSSDRLVAWNETEQKLEDVIKSTIVEIREE